MNYDKNLLKKIKLNYYLAKADLETIKELEEEIEKQILNQNEFYRSEECENRIRITDPFESFLMSKEDLDHFLDIKYEIGKREGIADTRGKDFIFSAKSNNNLKEAEKQLIEFTLSILPADLIQPIKEGAVDYKYKEELISLTLNLKC